MSYYAVIDIGSNSVRLVVFLQKRGGRLEEIENVKMDLRLRNYLNNESILSEEGIALLLSVIQGFKDIIDAYNLEELICAATATIRQAKNKQEIIDSIKEQTGFNIKVLTEEEEAFYGYFAVVNSTSLREGITIDIGGGSTEITYFNNRILQYSHSFPFGALTLKEFFENNQSYDRNALELRSFLFSQLNQLDWIKGRKVPIIGIGGSARNLVEIDQNQKKYPLAGLHQYEMSDLDFVRVIHQLSALNEVEMQKVEGLSKDRTDSILPAIEAIYCLFKLTEADRFILSRKGLREGLFYKKLAKGLGLDIFPNVLSGSMRELVEEYNINEEHILHMQKMVSVLFKQLNLNGIRICKGTDLKWLQMACTVFELGSYIDTESSARHTFYMIANRTIDGMTHKSRLRLALVASYKNKSLFKQIVAPYKEWFTKEERKQLLSTGMVLRFIYNLNKTKRQVVRDIQIQIEHNILTFHIKCKGSFMAESYQVEKQKRQLEKLLGHSIEFKFKRD